MSALNVMVVSNSADKAAAEKLVIGEKGPRYAVHCIADLSAMERFPGSKQIVLWWNGSDSTALPMEALGERLSVGKSVKYIVPRAPGVAFGPREAVEELAWDWEQFAAWASPVPEWSNGSFRTAVAHFQGELLPEHDAGAEAPTEPLRSSDGGSPDEPAIDPSEAEFMASLERVDIAEPEPEPEGLQPEHSVVFAAPQREGWGTPTDLWEATHLPEPPPGCLPACVEDYRLDRSALRGVDPSQAAISMPVAAAALIRESIYLQMTRNDPGGWREHARLWGAVIGDPSTRKDVGIKIGEGHLKHIALRYRAQEEAAREEFTHASKIHELQLAEHYREAKKNPLAQRPPAPERTMSQRLWVDDATLESLGGLLSAHARGKLLVSKEGELSGWFGSFDAYGNGKTDKDRPAYLAAYEGQERYIDRATVGKAYHVPSWSLCILGGIQPSVLATISKKLGHDGMLQRFMLCTSRAADEGEERQPDSAATGRWQAICENLHALEPHPNGPTMLSAQAQEFRKECGRWIHQTIKASAMSPALQAALGKWEGLLGRIMLTFHCIKAADAGRPMPDAEVRLDTAELAWAYIQRFLWPHAMHFYETASADTRSEHALRWGCGLILVRGWERFNLSQIARDWKGYRDMNAPQRREFLEQLSLIGWVRGVGGMARDGKASEFLVNPAVHDGRFEAHRERYAEERGRQRQTWLERHKEREPGSDG